MARIPAEGDLDTALKDLNLSNEEVDKFQKAFKDPEFLRLFGEYAKEVSDPKVKEETDLYLRQLESEGRGEEVYGKGTLLVVPTEAFVIKTQDTGSQHKAYINVCTSDKLDRISMQASKGPNGQAGRQVEIPLSLSGKKEGQDKAGRPCWVWDFVVHPETVATASTTPAIKKMMVDMAMEQIKNAHNVALSPDYKLLKIKYKGTPAAPRPHVLAVRPGGGAAAGAPGSRVQPMPNVPAVSGMPPHASAPPGQGPAPAAGASATAAPGQLQPATDGGAGGRSAFKFPAPKQHKQATPAQLAPHQAGYVHESGEVTPSWELIHRGQVDLGECWGDSGRQLAAAPTSYPEQLVLRVQLPGCSSAAGLQLDASRQAVSITMPGRYKLEAALPYPVDDSHGRAKFDKAKQQLEVVLPTLPPTRPAPPLAASPAAAVAAASHTADTAEEDIVAAAADAGAVAGEQQATTVCHSSTCSASTANTSELPEGTCSMPQAQEEHQRERQQCASGAEPGSSLEDGSEQKAQESQPAAAVDTGTAEPAGSGQAVEALTENQRRWVELHASAAPQAHGEAEALQASPRNASTSQEAERAAQESVLAAAGAAKVPAAAAQAPAHASQAALQAAIAAQLQPRLCSTLAEELD